MIDVSTPTILANLSCRHLIRDGSRYQIIVVKPNGKRRRIADLSPGQLPFHDVLAIVEKNASARQAIGLAWRVFDYAGRVMLEWNEPRLPVERWNGRMMLRYQCLLCEGIVLKEPPTLTAPRANLWQRFIHLFGFPLPYTVIRELHSQCPRCNASAMIDIGMPIIIKRYLS